MKARSIAFLLSALTLAGAAAAQAPSPRQLLVVYTREGGSSAEPPFVHLTVYLDGEAILARIEATVPNGRLCKAQVSPEAVDALAARLRGAGAFDLQDGAPFPDIPRSTVAYFLPIRGSRARANSFSYSGLVGPYGAVDSIIGAFIAANFANCH